MEKKRIAVIRVRGDVKKSKDMKDTMKILRLYRKNTCVVFTNTLSIVGMMKKVKDLITWGEIDKDTFKMMLVKRGKIAGNKFIDEKYMKEKTKMDFEEFANEFFNFKKELKDISGLKHFFRLKPPDKGFDRNGIKKAFSVGGALGYRKEKINDLIKRML